MSTVTKGIDEVKVVDVVETESGLFRLTDSYYEPFLSHSAKERKPSSVPGLLPLEKTPDIISFRVEKPNPTTFPFTTLSFSARSPRSSSPTDETTYTLSPDELSLGLQYNDPAGTKPLRDWLYGLQEFSHGRKRGEGWSICVGIGSIDLIYKAVHALVNDGDPVLIESPVYAGVIPIFESLHCNFIGESFTATRFQVTPHTLLTAEVETDAKGISDVSLRSTLENWPPDKPRPKVLYTVPYGCNPTGMTATLERRVEVLKLAREFDFIILEDDPYFYLYYGTAPRPASYFSLEAEVLPESGRVVRLDSFSKILSAGMRLGFASGPEAILGAIEKHTQTSSLQVSSLTQVIVHKLLESWGYEGLKVHTERVSEFYREKRDIFQAAMIKYLDGYAEWAKPEAGMFFWFKLILSTNHEVDASDSESAIRTTALEKGVLALPGTVFLPSKDKTAYVRAAFSLSPEEDVYEGLKRLRAAIAEVRGESA